MQTSRRNFLAGSAMISAGAMLPSNVIANTMQLSLAQSVVDSALVINGNLVPAFNEIPGDPEFLAQLRKSGLSAVKYSLGGSSAKFSDTVQHIGSIDRAIAEHSEIYTKIATADDILAAKRDGKIGIIYALEDAAMFEGDVEKIAYFAGLGVKSMQLSYNGTSPFASGVMAADKTAGLTEAGRDAVVTMNNVGVTIDVSHSNDASTLQIIEQSAEPVFISHGGCAGVFEHPRNKSDTVLRAVAEQGGVFGLYELAYLTPGLEQQNLADYMRHMLYAISVCGVDHVGIGSDALMAPFDTSPDSMAAWNASIRQRAESGIAAPGEGPPPFVVELNRVDRALIVTEALLQAGLSETDVGKILGGNFMRIFNQTW